MQTRLPAFLKTAALGLGLSVAAAARASALPVIPVTWNPSGVGISTQGPFQFDGFALNDVATIIFPDNPAPVGSIREAGFLLISQFDKNLVPMGNVNQTGPASWGMFERFTATSNGVRNGTTFTGEFDAITATVFAYKTTNGTATAGFNAAHQPVLSLPAGVNCSLLSNCVKLGTETGPIGGSANLATIAQGVPSAGVNTLFTPNAAESAFFVAPSALVKLDLDQAFINDPGAIKAIPCLAPCSVIIEIGGGGFPGGGDGNFIPEPPSLAVLGLGLCSFGLIRRRRT